jgi:hypothetical protein
MNTHKDYYKMWVQFISPCSLDQRIHSKFNEITLCTWTSFVVLRVNQDMLNMCTSIAHWQVKEDNENVNNNYLINEQKRNETNQQLLYYIHGILCNR